MINDCQKCGGPEARPLFGLIVEKVRLCPPCRVTALRGIATLQARHQVVVQMAPQLRVRQGRAV